MLAWVDDMPPEVRPVPDGVFVLDLIRGDGRRFTTSVSARSEIAAAVKRHDGRAGRVSHWRQDGEKVRVPMLGDFDDWRLNERYSL